jgi:hypothetical protein
MISLDDAFARIDDVISRVSPADEWIPVKEALDRLLVKDQFSKFDLPPFDRALRDGYVVAEGDERESYRVVGEIMAGAATRKRLAPGTAIKVATGAPLPKGAGRVIMRDHAEEKDGAVRVVGKSTRSYVSLKGSDVRKGDRILTPGEIGAVEIGNLISCGVTEIQVRRKLRIAIISTGDELVDTAAELKPGKVINTNAPMIAAMAQEYDLRVVFEKTVPDDPAATLRAIKSARPREGGLRDSFLQRRHQTRRTHRLRLERGALRLRTARQPRLGLRHLPPLRRARHQLAQRLPAGQQGGGGARLLQTQVVPGLRPGRGGPPRIRSGAGLRLAREHRGRLRDGGRTGRVPRLGALGGAQRGHRVLRGAGWDQTHRGGRGSRFHDILTAR